jgi:hypothetical protein
MNTNRRLGVLYPPITKNLAEIENHHFTAISPVKIQSKHTYIIDDEDFLFDEANSISDDESKITCLK